MNEALRTTHEACITTILPLKELKGTIDYYFEKEIYDLHVARRTAHRTAAPTFGWRTTNRGGGTSREVPWCELPSAHRLRKMWPAWEATACRAFLPKKAMRRAVVPRLCSSVLQQWLERPPRRPLLTLRPLVVT